VKVEGAGNETPSEPHAPAAEASKVETPPAQAKPVPEPLPSQLATAHEEAPEAALAPPPPEIKAVAAEPKVEPVPAQSKPASKPEPTQVVKTETVDETPVPPPAPSPPAIKQAAVEADSPKPAPAPVAESKPEVKPEPKAIPAEKPKETAASEAQGAPIAKPMSLGFGRAAAKPPAAGKVSSGRYAANVRAAIGRHRPGVRGGGSATVAFSIGPAGGLQGVQIVRSSGKPALDQAAIATVRSAAPFPPPPPGVKSNFSIQIYFR
jgi:protein TonB